jgi:hypothetical protein
MINKIIVCIGQLPLLQDNLQGLQQMLLLQGLRQFLVQHQVVFQLRHLRQFLVHHQVVIQLHLHRVILLRHLQQFLVHHQVVIRLYLHQVILRFPQAQGRLLDLVLGRQVCLP